jgi:hypothetical protein
MAQAPAPLPSLGLILNEDFVLLGDKGAFVLAGQAATFNFVGPNSAGAPAYLPAIGLILGVDSRASPGAFTLTGIAAALRSTRRLVGAAGSFSLTGQAALFQIVNTNVSGNPGPLPSIGLVLGGSASNKFVLGAAGAFAVSGQAAALTKGLSVFAATGTFVLTGAPAERDTELNGETGVFTLNGQAAALTRTYTPLATEAGTFVLTGQNAFTVYETPGIKVLPAFAGIFTLAGQDANFTLQPQIEAETGVFILGGQNATLTWSGEALIRRNREAGASRRRDRLRERRNEERKLFTVRVDGEDFVVASEAQAVAFVEVAREVAQRKAEAQATEAVRSRASPVDLDKPEVEEGAQELSVEVTASLKAELDAIYQRATEQAERAIQEQLDEDEALVLLLLA